MNSSMARLALALLVLMPGLARAADMPVAAGSPIAGIVFDDRPLMLPVQRNFQMAMLTVSSELGRSCGRMEAYGWRLEGDEQQRVNQIFNNTIDRIRAQGFVVESKKTNSVSSDVTLFTADNQDKHLIFLWSAGDIGLVMVLCETSAPLTPTRPLEAKNETAQTVDMPEPYEAEREQRRLARLSADERRPQTLGQIKRPADETFSPVGNWTGSYTCAQGTTGATLTISSLDGDKFEGVFDFYPTAKNPYVPKGSYKVFGEYDKESQRILVNPGAWIQRPKGYYSTILIGSLDTVDETFSAFFQGITGCTSFEARLEREDGGKKTPVAKAKTTAKKDDVVKKKTKKKSVPAKKAEPKKEVKIEVRKDPEPILPVVKEATPEQTQEKTVDSAPAVPEAPQPTPPPSPASMLPRASAIEMPSPEPEGIKLDTTP